MTSEQQLYLTLGQQQSNATESQMFGKPCFKVNGKAFVCFFNNSMVFKLSGYTYEEALSLDRSVLFDPSGKKRPMKEWVQVEASLKDKWAEYTSLLMDTLKISISYERKNRNAHWSF